jgi:hypothetical protein
MRPRSDLPQVDRALSAIPVKPDEQFECFELFALVRGPTAYHRRRTALFGAWRPRTAILRAHRIASLPQIARRR